MYRLYLFLKRSLITMLSYRTALALGIIGSLVGLLQFTFMGRFLTDGNDFPALAAYGGNLMAYLIIGTALTSFLGVSLGSFQQALRSEQQMGTLEYLLLSDTRIEFILVATGVIGFVQTLLNVVLLLAAVVLIFGIQMNINLLAASITTLLTITALSGIGMMSAGIIIVTKVGDPISWCFTTLTGLFSGVLFPVEYLPAYLKPVSAVLPTTYALDALRLTLVKNASIDQITPQLLFLLTMSLISLPLGFIVVRLGYNRARQAGTLAHY